MWRRPGKPERRDAVWRRGERVAQRHLRKQGLRTIARNLRMPHGEIDLLCRDTRSGAVVVVEVKSRMCKDPAERAPDPTAGITSRKRAKLVSLARAVQKSPRYRGAPIRIDVVSVRFVGGWKNPEVRHYPGAVGDR